MGDDIFEMYVTDKIDLPVHTILLVGVSLNGMFPLKIKRFSSNLPMISEIYQAVKVIKL